MAKLFMLALISMCSTGRKSYEIPEFVYENCKFTDICNRTATKQPPSDQATCCKSCSCKEDCGLTLNCCFDHLDTYNLVEKGIISCINPLAYNTQAGYTLRVHEVNYYMVTSCADVTVSDQCRWTDDNNSSILAPVTEVKTNTTYVHEACAKCNNVDTFVKWNYFYNDYGVNYASTMWKFEDSTVKKIGSKLFAPPLNISNSVKECHVTTETITCDKTSPNYNVCQTLRSPYVEFGANRVYNNVACYSCKENVSLYTDLCPSVLYLRHYTEKFTVLIDSRVAEEMSTGRPLETTERYSNQETCPRGSIKSQLKERCLQIYCPETMVRTDKGCEHLYLFWYPRELYMQVKLLPTPATFLPVLTLTSLSAYQLRYVDSWIDLPCDELKPFLYAIYYENASLQYVKSLEIRLIKRTVDGISPAKVLPILEKCTKQPWVLQLDNTSYSFLTEISRHYNYVQDGRTSRYWTVVNNDVEYIRPKLYDKLKVYDGSVNSRNGYNLQIRKTFFCRQVRLPFDEVEINIEEVRILSTNKTLGNNEFEINNATWLAVATSKAGNAESSVTVCIDDYIKSTACSETMTNQVFECAFLLYIQITLLEIILM